jgi:hypothetical protein
MALETLCPSGLPEKFTLSDGRQIEVHPDDLEELQKRDPDLKIDDEE